jgi:hypothetical protein
VRETAALLDAHQLLRPAAPEERMLILDLVRDPNTPFRVLALGAHCDDIEIRLRRHAAHLLERTRTCASTGWCSRRTRRAAREAEAAAEALPRGAKEKRVVIKQFRNGYFPDQWARSRTTSSR